MLIWRLGLGAGLILTLIGLCALDVYAEIPEIRAGALSDLPLVLPGLFLMPVVVLAAMLATQEIVRLAAAGGVQVESRPIYYGNLLIVIGQWLPVFYGTAFHWRSPRVVGYMELFLAASRSPLWSLGLAVVFVFYFEMARYEKPGGSLVRIAVSIFALVYVGVMMAFAVQIRLFWGVGALSSWIITVKMGDIGAYTVGRLFGRTKMSPKISPGKTMEGALGAILFACLGSLLCFRGTSIIDVLDFFNLPHSPRFHDLPAIVSKIPSAVMLPPGTPWGWLLFGLVMAITGMMADLAESLLKRDVGCKDSSDWMPGFGGVLDILDSLLLSAPFAWLLWSTGVVGPGQ